MLNKKGVAGLDVWLSVITMIFVIGLLVMIFALMSGELETVAYDISPAATIVNETLTTVDGGGENVSISAFRDVALTGVVVTDTTGGEVITAPNYSISVGNVRSITNGNYNNSDWNITFTYTYSADTTASNIINDTSTELAEVTNWFGIIIVISAMVVLILLTVIIIRSIKASGLMGDR